MKGILEKISVLVAVLSFALTAIMYFNSAAASPALATLISPTNGSYTSVNYTFINITSSENLSAANVTWGWYNSSAFVNISMSNSSLTNWYVNITGIPNTPATVWHNFTIRMLNSTGTLNISERYSIKIDTQTPVVDQITTFTTVSYFTNESYENYIQLKANVTDNTTQSCGFRIFYENLTDGSSPILSYPLSATTFTGTLTADAAVRNCTYNLTGSQVKNIVGNNAVFIVQAYGTDAVNKTGYTVRNESFVFNYLPAGMWSPLGHVEANTLTKNFTTDTSLGNISYVSLFNNTWESKAFVTYRYGYASNNVTIDNSTWSGFLAYTSTGWNLLRKNSTQVSNVVLWAAPYNINQTDNNCSVNTTFLLTKTPVNSSFTILASNATNSLTVTLNNATDGNVTVGTASTGNVTFQFKWNSMRSPWNLVGAQNTNTTWGFANQSANITYISFIDPLTGYYQTFRKGFSFNENVTIHRGQAVWVQTNMDSDTLVVKFNRTVEVNPTNVTWSR